MKKFFQGLIALVLLMTVISCSEDTGSIPGSIPNKNDSITHVPGVVRGNEPAGSAQRVAGDMYTGQDLYPGNDQVQIIGEPGSPATNAGQYANLSFQRSGSFQDWGSAWHRAPANLFVRRNRSYLELVSSLLYSKKEVLDLDILWDAFSMSAYTVKNLHGERPVDPEGKAIKVTRNLMLLLKYVEYANTENRGDVRLKAALEDMLEDLSFLPTQYAATVRGRRHELEGQISKGWGFDDNVALTHEGAEWIDTWGGNSKAVPIAHF